MGIYQHEEEGVIYVWNTGRPYENKYCQVIAAVKIPYKSRIVFWDSSRHIDGSFPARRGNTREQTVAAYDNGCYEDYCEDNNVMEQLTEAATKWKFSLIDTGPFTLKSEVMEVPLKEDDGSYG
jgi:hypothetical protein